MDLALVREGNMRESRVPGSVTDTYRLRATACSGFALLFLLLVGALAGCLPDAEETLGSAPGGAVNPNCDTPGPGATPSSGAGTESNPCVGGSLIGAAGIQIP